MKLMKTEDAVGQVLCHDITQIIKGVTKDAVFRKGHIITEEDIPVLLSVGKDNIYIWEKDDTKYHEDEAADILRGICQNEYMRATDPKEGKIELIAETDGLFQVDEERLLKVNSLPEMMIATRRTNFPVKKGDKLAGTRVIPLVIEKEKMEAALSETKLQEYKVTEEDGKITIYAKGVSAHASTPAFGVNAAGVIFDCLAKAGFEDDFVEFYNSHIGTACDGSGIGLKCADEFGELTFCNGIVKTEDGVISATIDIRFPVTYSVEDMLKMCEGKLEDENGRIEIHTTTKPLFFPKESPLVEALYKAYTDVTGDTENKPLVIGGGTYAKSLKNIIAFGPEKPGVDYRIHGADEYTLVSEVEEAVHVYMEAIKNLLAI